MSLDNGTESPEEEIPNHDDLAASNIDAEANSFLPKDEIPRITKRHFL